MKRGRRERDYLFQRAGSRNWHIRLQGDPRIERSLGTSDRRQAEIIALPLIAQHRARVLARQPRFVTGWWHEFEPGREHALPDGTKILATAKELHYVGQNGSIIRTEPNGGPQYTHPTRLKEPSFELFDKERATPTLAVKNSDDALFEGYLTHANVGQKYVSEARQVWEMYKSLVGKPLKTATREDGRALVKYFEEKGNKSATIQKKIGWLVAMCNFGIGESRLTFNPFSSVVPRRDDALRRKPFSADDIATIKANLDKLDPSYQLLIRLLACTGMRLGEAFQITEEDSEEGIRYVTVGTKTAQSLRRVPLPEAVLPFLPARIEAPLFHGDAGRASRTLGKFLRDIHITDKAKVIHSFRHRAQDRLRAVGCPEDKRWAILGHEEETIAAGYGEGFPVSVLKDWIDKIGF